MLDKTLRELIYFSITNPVKLMMSSERMNLYCLLCNGTFIPFVSDWLLKTNKLQLKFTVYQKVFLTGTSICWSFDFKYVKKMRTYVSCLSYNKVLNKDEIEYSGKKSNLSAALAGSIYKI